ncbi:hypothetical protein N7501_005140 [Penicillium viridicatum]|nr:hypothetical protein N7501_005140 [Penicillium viridicatum]
MHVVLIRVLHSRTMSFPAAHNRNTLYESASSWKEILVLSPNCSAAAIPPYNVLAGYSLNSKHGYYASTLGYGSSPKLESDLVLGSNPANSNTKRLSQASVLEAERFI